MKRSLLFVAVLALGALPAYAKTLIVEGVVSPAWVERADGRREPLTAGMALRERDKVYTGPGSRALLRMAEGSAVKLGENAILTVDDLLEKKGVSARQFVAASLDVARGAFRFTSNVFGRERAERDIKIRITTVTAGIRGTDLWGKSGEDRDIVCLIEGRISVNHGGQDFTMQEPLSFFIAPRQGKPAPVAPVAPAQLKEWAEETEIQAGSGAVRRGGRLSVEVSSAGDQQTALRDYDKLREAGYPAQIRPVKTPAGEEFRVRILNLPGIADARALVQKLNGLGFTEAKTAK
jgi:hypothetical protein